MDNQRLHEKILRSWYFWAFIVPLLVTSIVFILIGAKSGFKFLDLLIFGIFTFPLYIIDGMTYSIIKGVLDMSDKRFAFLRILIIISTILGSVGYIFFILKVRNMNKKTLYWISLLILILIIFGVKGCVTSINNIPGWPLS